MADAIKLKSLNMWISRGRGLVCIVENPTECQDYKHLIQRDAVIDGESYFITGVEHFAHAPPYRVGEKIGLVLRSLGAEKVSAAPASPAADSRTAADPSSSDAA